MGFIGFPVQQNPISFLSNYRRFGINGNATSGGNANQTGLFAGGTYTSAGNGATSYGKTAYSSMYGNDTALTGAGINFANGIGFAGIGLFYIGSTSTAGQAVRIIVGDDSQGTIPAASGTNALTTRGFGFEIQIDSGVRKLRVFAHNGTTYSTSAYNTNFTFSPLNRNSNFWIKNDPSGNVYLYFSQAADDDGNLPSFPQSPTITLAGGPTSSTSAKRYVTVNCIMDGTNNPASATATICKLFETIATAGV
jgi:hypothetical protein